MQRMNNVTFCFVISFNNHSPRYYILSKYLLVETEAVFH
jgi:hypothetical protein